MSEFVQRHASKVIGTLSGFDRLLFRGTLLRLANVAGLLSFLSYTKVLLKDFGDWSSELTERVKRRSLEMAEESGRSVRYLPDPSVRKEELARRIAGQEGIEQGLVCLFSAVEPCLSYEIHRNAQTKKLELQPRRRRCLHHYHYWMHPEMGLCHARVQTWLPFNVFVCVNGREWLARQMDGAGIGYRRRENCFVEIADLAKAQQLMDRQLKTNWSSALNQMARQASPGHVELFGSSSTCPIDMYWSAQQSEWATDVLRFLGKRVPENRNAHPCFKGQVLSDLKDRPEGMRLKHAVDGNSVKMYDKQGSVLRIETTINQPEQFKVYRGTQEDPGKKDWRPLRKGVADLHRRAQVSQSSNQRYLKAMAAIDSSTPLKDLAAKLCRPVKRKGRRARALNPLALQDATLLAAVSRGEFLVNGFRNRDMRALLHGSDPKNPAEKRRRSAAGWRNSAA